MGRWGLSSFFLGENGSFLVFLLQLCEFAQDFQPVISNNVQEGLGKFHFFAACCADTSTQADHPRISALSCWTSQMIWALSEGTCLKKFFWPCRLASLQSKAMAIGSWIGDQAFVFWTLPRPKGAAPCFLNPRTLGSASQWVANHHSMTQLYMGPKMVVPQKHPKLDHFSIETARWSEFSDLTPRVKEYWSAWDPLLLKPGMIRIPKRWYPQNHINIINHDIPWLWPKMTKSLVSWCFLHPAESPRNMTPALNAAEVLLVAFYVPQLLYLWYLVIT